MIVSHPTAELYQAAVQHGYTPTRNMRLQDVSRITITIAISLILRHHPRQTIRLTENAWQKKLILKLMVL